MRGMLLSMSPFLFGSVCLEDEKWAKCCLVIGSRDMDGGWSACCDGVFATIDSPHNQREVFAKNG